MSIRFFAHIPEVVSQAKTHLLNTTTVEEVGKWQGTNEHSKQRIKILYCWDFRVRMPENQVALQEDSGADQPWAEDHFQERISGSPLNPGKTYKYWPYNKFKEKGDSYLEGGEFTHTYMQRYFPPRLKGIKYNYGDLNNLIDHLKGHINSRQGYLPVWYPEDTGAEHGGRLPCTLGYLFFVAEDYLSCNYYIRSCDFYRHFKNDIYLTIRLAQHLYSELKAGGNNRDLKLGVLNMYVANLHLFEADINRIK